MLDEGPGVPPDQRELIFQLFVSIPRPTPEQFRRGSLTGTTASTGLGLWIARMLVQNNGGTLKCGSGPKGGALFVCRFAAGPQTVADARVTF